VSSATNNSNLQNERSEVITREFHTEHNQVRAADHGDPKDCGVLSFPQLQGVFSDSRQV